MLVMLSGYADSVDLFGISLAIGGVFVPPSSRPPLRTGLNTSVYVSVCVLLQP